MPVLTRSLTLAACHLDMDKNTALLHLQQCADTLKRMGATSLFLFGSTARDEAHPSSDLDLFIDYAPSKPISILDLVSMKQFLETELSVCVDITTRNSLHPMLRTDIELSAIRIF